MKRIVALLVLILLTHPAFAEPLTFSATGCGPYAPAEEPLLARYVDLAGKDGKSEFLVHLGDVVSGSQKKWPESQYEKVAGILKKSEIPVVVVPGDNEWNDLTNPDEGWKFWSKHFMNFEKNFAKSPKIAHQEARPENFAWVSKGVLIVGLNLPGGFVHDKKEWTTRHAQNNEWVKEQLKEHGDKVRAMVVLAQAEPNASHESFFKPFIEQVKAWGKPTLYLHADKHKWEVHKKWRADNLMRVMTDQVRLAPPVLVTVTDDAEFVFDRRK